MLAAVETAGVKHAYGATTQYAPGLSKARSLIADGVIGDVQEVEVVTHFGMSPLHPYCWIHSLEHGGGVLRERLHPLPRPDTACDRRDRAMGDRTRRACGHSGSGGASGARLQGWEPLQQAEAAAAEWQDNDADLAATVITELELPDARRVPTLFSCFGVHQRSRRRLPRHLRDGRHSAPRGLPVAPPRAALHHRRWSVGGDRNRCSRRSDPIGLDASRRRSCRRY